MLLPEVNVQHICYHRLGWTATAREKKTVVLEIAKTFEMPKTSVTNTFFVRHCTKFSHIKQTDQCAKHEFVQWTTDFALLVKKTIFCVLHRYYRYTIVYISMYNMQ